MKLTGNSLWEQLTGECRKYQSPDNKKDNDLGLPEDYSQ